MSTLRVNNLKSRTGTAVTITSGHGLDVEGNLKITGVSTFSGITSFTNGANVTGVTTFEQASFAQNANFTGVVTAQTFSGNIIGVAATFSGALTYEDVTNVDSVGLITARNGILVGAGKSVGIGTVTPGVGIGLEVHNTEATGTFINVKSKSNTLAGINFGDFEDDNIGAIKYSNGSNTLRIFANAGERFRIGEAGQLGIGGATYGSSGQVLTSGGASAAPTWAAASAGKVLQVKQVATETQISTTSDSDLLVLSITPSATTSNILVICQWFMGGNSNPNGGYKLTRGGTVVEGSATTTGQYSGASGTFWSMDDHSGTIHSMESHSFNFLDTGPSGNGVNTTSAVEYKLSTSSFSQIYYNRNASGTGYGKSTMILMEIGA